MLPGRETWPLPSECARPDDLEHPWEHGLAHRCQGTSTWSLWLAPSASSHCGLRIPSNPKVNKSLNVRELFVSLCGSHLLMPIDQSKSSQWRHEERSLPLCLSPLPRKHLAERQLSLCGMTLLSLSPYMPHCPFLLSLAAEAGTGRGPPVPSTVAESEHQRALVREVGGEGIK